VSGSDQSDCGQTGPSFGHKPFTAIEVEILYAAVVDGVQSKRDQLEYSQIIHRRHDYHDSLLFNRHFVFLISLCFILSIFVHL